MSRLLELVRRIGETFALRTKLVSELFVQHDRWTQLHLSKICIAYILSLIWARQICFHCRKSYAIWLSCRSNACNVEEKVAFPEGSVGPDMPFCNTEIIGDITKLDDRAAWCWYRLVFRPDRWFAREQQTSQGWIAPDFTECNADGNVWVPQTTNTKLSKGREMRRQGRWKWWAPVDVNGERTNVGAARVRIRKITDWTFSLWCHSKRGKVEPCTKNRSCDRQASATVDPTQGEFHHANGDSCDSPYTGRFHIYQFCHGKFLH